MKVKWIEYYPAHLAMEMYNTYPEFNACDLDITHEGDVIGTNKSFWGATYLVVACIDDKIREVNINECRILKL